MPGWKSPSGNQELPAEGLEAAACELRAPAAGLEAHGATPAPQEVQIRGRGTESSPAALSGPQVLDHELVALQLLVLPSWAKSPFLGTRARAGGPRKSHAASPSLLMNHPGF